MPKKPKELVANNEKLLTEWDYSKNEELGFFPEKVSSKSNKKIWWKCENGHSYLMTIKKKTSRGRGCPVCSGHKTVAGINDFLTCFPELATEWHPTRNGDLRPSDLSRKNGKKVWWRCQYGHEWEATPKDRANDNTGCPFCKARRQTSFSEQAIYYYVKKLYPDATNRSKELFSNKMELDIYIPSIQLGIEYDGAAWHNSEEVHKKEREKYNLCREKQITLIRVKEETGKEWRDVADTMYIIKNRRDRYELTAVIKALLDSIDRNSSMWTRKNPLCFHSTIEVDLERDENEIKEYLVAIPNSLEELRPDLVEEWNQEKNGNLSPKLFGINANDRVWWKCKKCGYEWRTSVIQRGGKRQSGCPECSKKLRGETFTARKVKERGSLAENNPELAKEWHPTKNGEVTAFNVTEKRFKNAWWRCSKCGYEWEASPNNRSKGSGCPCCSGRVPKTGVNDFQTLFPRLVNDWDFEKNGIDTPDKFLPKSGKKVWWKCSICGYSWKSEIRNRSSGHGCPNYRKH